MRLGIEWKWKRGCLASQSFTSCFLWVRVVIDDAVQIQMRGAYLSTSVRNFKNS